MAAWHVALVGATGIVGEEILRVLEERDFPLDQLTLLASRRSAGTRVEFSQPELRGASAHQGGLARCRSGPVRGRC